MDFVLVLHSHLPLVLGHGRWPHGSDWLMEAAVSCYLPLIDRCEALRHENVDAPITLSVTPVLAAQLAAPEFPRELRAFFAQRLAACDEAERELAASDQADLVPLVHYWRDTYLRGLRQFDALDGDLIGVLRRLERDGRIELMSSAATHGFLPLLARDESIRLQLFAGRDEHVRLFGREPAGCWLPECAYRPRGAWAPWLPDVDRLDAHRDRDAHGCDAGYRFVGFRRCPHLAQALVTRSQAYGSSRARPLRRPATARARRIADYSVLAARAERRSRARSRSRVHAAGRPRRRRYPERGARIWSFINCDFPAGFACGKSQAPAFRSATSARTGRHVAPDEAHGHARHFARLARVDRHAARTHTRASDRVIVAPFDAELFGHWWFEGPGFLAETYRALRESTRRRCARRTASSTPCARRSADTPLDLPAGSWGRDGDFSMWLNEQTAWTWRRLWEHRRAVLEHIRSGRAARGPAGTSGACTGGARTAARAVV